MATKKEIDEQLQSALEEVGDIKPWFDKEVEEWVFAHPLYPVEYGGDTAEEVTENYPKYLREFIAHRLDDQLNPLVEKETKGRGGARPGAGRPPGTRKSPPTKQIRVPEPTASFVKSFAREHRQDIIDVMEGRKEIRFKKI